MNSVSTSTVSLLPRNAQHAAGTQKDYAAAFADLQSRYGLGTSSLPAPPNCGSPRSQPTSSTSHTTNTTAKKWIKWPLARGVGGPSLKH
ncbi:hypothetical protein V8B97DRAFT_1144824 [Scleroderma yunnanense]